MIRGELLLLELPLRDDELEEPRDREGLEDERLLDDLEGVAREDEDRDEEERDEAEDRLELEEPRWALERLDDPRWDDAPDDEERELCAELPEELPRLRWASTSGTK